MTISSSSHFVSRELAAEFSKYFEKNFSIVSVDGRKAVLSRFNKLSDNEFHSQGVRFTVDYEKGTVTNTESYEPLSKESENLLTELKGYVKDHYGSEVAYDVFDKEDGPLVVIVGRKFSSTNFFNGQWTSHYTVDGKNVKGEISVDVHYFEDGNVRLKSSMSVDKSDACAIDAIRSAEDEYEKEVNKKLVGLNEAEFKSLRRQLPVTRERMIWGRTIAGYKVGRELEQKEE